LIILSKADASFGEQLPPVAIWTDKLIQTCQEQCMSIVYLNQVRSLRKSDSEARNRHEDELARYIVSYRLDDRTFSTEIVASSMDEAEAHVEAMRLSVELRGELVD
jgi:hypothetical protein